MTFSCKAQFFFNGLRYGEAQRFTRLRHKVKLGMRKQEPVSGGSQNPRSYL